VSQPSRSDALQELDIKVDRHADVPIGVQLAWALRARIRDGRLSSGHRLPGLRDLALALGVNANTVRSVYQRLEQDGVIVSQQGSGTFVASRPRRSAAIGTIAADAARAARETGVDPREVAAALYVTAPRPRDDDQDEQAERRRRLRTQIGALEQTLAELELRHPSLASPPPDELPQAGPRLLDAEQLERIQTRLLRRLSEVQAAIDDLPKDHGQDGRAPKPVDQRKRPSRARNKPRTAPAGGVG
jgi:GntR family transcriptional regulator